jgi:Protein of unknown function (DUF1097)
MDLGTALAVSISVLGAIATFVFLQFTSLQIWAAFVAWATFYHCGGQEAGLLKAVTHSIFGAILGWLALVLATKAGLATAMGTAGIAVAVLITVFILVIAAKIPTLSDIPASVYGYASVVALFAVGGMKADITAASLENPLLNIILSMIVGALLGYASQKVAVALSSK